MKPRWAAAGLAIAGLLAYHNCFEGAFVFDDKASIVDNRTLRRLADALFPPPGGLTVSGRPFLNLSLALNHAISGNAVWSYHALNLLIQVAAGCALFGIARRTIERTPWAAGSMPIAFGTALLWTVHPVQTESVTYLVQRAESLMGLCFLLTLYAFIRSLAAEARPRARWAALSVLACWLGMATKETMAAAPLLVLAYDRAFAAGSLREAWRRRRGYYAALGASWLLLGVLAAFSGSRGGTAGFGPGRSWTAYWLAQCPAVLRYLRLAAWPHPLVIDYGMPPLPPAWLEVGSLLTVAGLLAATAWASRPRSNASTWGFLGLWFFAFLAPSSLVPGYRQTLAEHRMYLPLAAVISGVVAAGWRIARPSPGCFWSAVLVLAACLGLVTERRNQAYGHPATLWLGAVAARPGNGFAHDDLGTAWLDLGKLDDAEREYRTAVRLAPGFSQARYNLGNVLERRNAFAEASVEFSRALTLDPNLPDAHAHLGRIALRLGRLDDARAQFEAAVRLDPGSADAHGNLAIALARAGRGPEAEVQFARALALDPRSAAANYNLGNFLFRSGRLDEAIAHFRKAVAADPGTVDARENLAIALSRTGRPEEAAGELRRALALAPDRASLHDRLGEALIQLGRPDEARGQFAQALRLDPSDLSARRDAALVGAPRPR